MPDLGFAQTTAYTIEDHKHRFAAWAASRAAFRGMSVTVELGRGLLESCGLAEVSNPEQLPAPESFDGKHRQWRSAVVDAAKAQGISFTHGVAAKLINVYLKSRFVCGGYYAHERVRTLHPPIDRETP